MHQQYPAQITNQYIHSASWLKKNANEVHFDIDICCDSPIMKYLKCATFFF